MHILVVSDAFYPEISAPSARWLELGREMTRLGHEVTVLTCAPNFPQGRLLPGYRNRLFQREKIEGITVCRVWSFMVPNEGILLRTLDFMSFALSASLQCWRVKKPDVVIGTSPQLFAGAAGALIARLRGARFVFEVRDLWPDAVAELGVVKRRALAPFFWLAQLLYRKADAIVTVGPGYARQLQEWHGISANRLGVITNGVDETLFSSANRREAMRAHYGWKEDDFVVIYLGTHGLSQNLSMLLHAAARLRDERRIRFVLIGDGAEKTSLSRQRDEMHLENCELWPTQPRDAVPALYEAADACVVMLARNALFEGTYPSKLFEAMAMNCPIFLSVEGESAELVRRAEGGICLPPDDSEALANAILSASRDASVLAPYREGKARRFMLAGYTRAALAKRYVNFLQEMPCNSSPH